MCQEKLCAKGLKIEKEKLPNPGLCTIFDKPSCVPVTSRLVLTTVPRSPSEYPPLLLSNLLLVQLSTPNQLLYLTLTNLVGGGALATGFSLLAILATPFREQLAWSRYALTAIATTWYIPALLVTTRIRIKSKARPPVTSLIIGLGCVVGGFVLSHEVDIVPDNLYFPSTY